MDDPRVTPAHLALMLGVGLVVGVLVGLLLGGF